MISKELELLDTTTRRTLTKFKNYIVNDRISITKRQDLVNCIEQIINDRIEENYNER